MSERCDYDVVIAGGGMVGASLALQLSHANSDLNILVVESFPLPAKNSAPVYRPSFDARSTALSYGSRQILEQLGLWPQLAQQLSAIEQIHVSEKGALGSSLMSAAEMGWPALGYVVENAWLGNILLSALRQRGNVDFFCPASVQEVIPQPEGVAVEILDKGAEQARRVSSQLIVVADGAQSGLREKLGIDVERKDYGQAAIIANVCFDSPHGGIAYERFTRWGPMALLPLADSERGEPRAALVWSNDNDAAEQLMQCSEEDFLNTLQQRFGHRLGAFNRLGERASYPLQLVEACEQVRSGVVVMGNAAHSLHPVAGQGFNLALRDCSRLCELLSGAHGRSETLGALPLLLQYQQQQQWDQQKTVGFSDKVVALFAGDSQPLKLLRSLGLGALDILPAPRSEFIRHAAGVHGDQMSGVSALRTQ